ncbi:MAG: class I tRNA ligase family protein, partial [Gemmatimonadota bacterium]
DGAKMSKSGPKVVSPDGYAERYGADTLRTYLMFLGPFQQGGDFSDRGIAGVRRFYERLWRYATESPLRKGEIRDRGVLGLLHRQIGKVTEAIEGLRYNGAVAALMELLNGLSCAPRHYRAAVETLLQLAAPFAPFITQELWERLGRAGAIEAAPWPEYDASLAQADTVEWVVQVNGRIRDRMELPAGTAPEAAGELAADRERVRPWTAGKEEVRRVVVPERLVNIVVREA